MLKTIKETLRMGVRSIYHNRKFIFLLWGANALSAFVLAIPVYAVLLDSLKQSILSDKLALNFDYIWFIQFLNIYKSNLTEIPFMLYGMMAIYLLVQTFFLGGLISVFKIPAKNHTVDFFYGGVKYFVRFTKLMLFSVLFILIAFLINDYLGSLILSFFENSENIRAEFILMSLRYILLIFLIGIGAMISDYSKVNIAVKDNFHIFKTVYETVKFLKHNFTKVFLLFLIVAIFGAVGAVIYNLVRVTIPETPFYFLIVSFILQQMLIIFRLFIRMLFYSTEVILFKDLSAEIISPKVNKAN
ncbi:MAG: hypothetical protein A2068_13435 [Ignavibacteria bacterium GWB2_35_6b]|nr:MAG: hypothetical protein A2068_13435 [Ignavibacteria bacterium GWB2_35_6b]